jgi:NAD(P)-dependent dehydrogenase (short-subunit alcohol dehydrogenase family)
MTRHSERVALVTGAGSGIGRAISLRLAAEGAKVMVTDLNGASAEETVNLIEHAGGVAQSAVVDVRERETISAAVAQVKASWGELHLLVNAGLVTKHNFSNLTEDAWDLVLDVNLKGQWLVSQESVPLIEASGGGAIVNLSTVEASVVVTSGSSAQPHYNASKAGVPMLTKALAVELAPKNIRVNCVAPGPIQTNFFDLEAITSDEGMAFAMQRLLVPRLGQPEDIASAVSWLLSDEASFVDGIQLPVDGGWLTR